MPPRSRKSPKPQKPKLVTTPAVRNSPDLSFPLSYSEQQHYLELADLFLALDEMPSRSSDVIPMESLGPRRLRKAA